VARSSRSFDVHSQRPIRVTHHDGVLHQTSLRSRWTMMTLANSLHSREAGRPINVAVTRERGPELTRAFPHGHRAYDCRASPRRQNSA